MGYSEYRGSLAAPNRETVGSRNGFCSESGESIGTIRRQEVIPQTGITIHPQRPDPSELLSGPQRGSAEIKCSEERNWVTTSICQSGGL